MKLHSLLVAATLVPSLALAAPTVTFEGEVTDQTCQALINGQTDAVVLLPTVPASELVAAGAVTGLTPFTISITGCVAPTNNLPVGTKFYGRSATAAGNLENLATGGTAAQNVQIQLTTNADGDAQIDLSSGVVTVSGLELGVGETEASYQFGARYISEIGGATPGRVTAVAEYTLSYL